jgi:hypothetical protein
MPTLKALRKTSQPVAQQLVWETKRKGGPGRTPTYYEYQSGGILHRHTVAEWQFLLGLADRNTFYNRLKAWRTNPRRHPVAWVFRCAETAPFAQLLRDQTVAPAPLSPADAAVIRQTVQSDLADIIGEYE